MKIKTQLSATIGGMVVLLMLVAISGYFATTVVNQAGSIIPTSLVPGIQNYNDLRYKTLEIALHGYEGEIKHAAEMAEPLLPRIDSFVTVEADSPFLGDAVLEDGLPYIGQILLNVIDTTLALEENGEPTDEFIQAVDALEAMDEEANIIIQHLIDATTQKINGVIGTIVKGLAVLGIIAVAISLGIGSLLLRKLTSGITDLQQSFSRISEGDLTTLANDQRADELGEIAGYFNGLAESLKKTISQVAQLMETLSELSGRFSDSGEQFQQRAQDTSEETQLVATAMTEMAATVREVAQNAELTSNRASDASNEADSARGLVDKTVASSQQLQNKMGSISDQVIQLKDKTESISSVIDVIQGIAEQTNLLALNAAIEAARAGEQGRGFAVVADEVRSLATRTGQSTQEIVDVIQALQAMSEKTASEIAEGQQSVEQNAESITNIETSLNSILGSISSISDMNHQIATNSQEQSHVAEDMNNNVVRISDLSEQNVTQIEQINSDIKTIEQLTKDVRELISVYTY